MEHRVSGNFFAVLLLMQLIGAIKCCADRLSCHHQARIQNCWKDDIDSWYRGGTSIGKLDMVWRTNMGERGRLQTSALQRMVRLPFTYLWGRMLSGSVLFVIALILNTFGTFYLLKTSQYAKPIGGAKIRWKSVWGTEWTTRNLSIRGENFIKGVGGFYGLFFKFFFEIVSCRPYHTAFRGKECSAFGNWFTSEREGDLNTINGQKTTPNVA